MFNRIYRVKFGSCALIVPTICSCGGVVKVHGMENKYFDDLPKTSNVGINKFIEELRYDAQQVLNALLVAQYKSTVDNGIETRLGNEKIYIKYLRNPNLESNSELTQEEKSRVKKAKEETEAVTGGFSKFSEWKGREFCANLKNVEKKSKTYLI